MERAALGECEGCASAFYCEQGEVSAFHNFVREMKDTTIASQKAQVAHMAAIIADLAPGYVYDTTYDVLVPV